jgi:alcohol dehydrogenase (cytochrome c)
MKGFDIIRSTNAFKLEIVLFVLLIIFAISNIFNITLVPTNVFSDQSLGETKQQQQLSEKVAEGEVESTTMKHITTNSQQSFNSQDIKLPTSTQQKTDLGTEAKNKNNWVTVNHDIYGTRSSNQTIINKDNVGKLQVKWRLVNEFEIQDPPIIVDNRGYVQDYAGNILAFDTRTGHVIWKVHAGNGPTTGLAFGDGVLFASTASNATILAINSSNGKTIWQSQALGNPKAGYRIDAAPIVWKDYIIAGSAGASLPPGTGLVKGNITALNRTSGEIIWKLDTTTGEWVKPGKTPPNGGAAAWSGGSLDPETGIVYIPLGNPSPNFNASTRQTLNLYSNHMVAVNITNGKMIWATPFIAYGTVLNVRVPDTHDWDTSWGSSISKVTFDNGTQKKVVVGHDKMGNVIAMDAATGKEIWWRTIGKQYNTNRIPLPNGSGMIWSYGVNNYHAVDNSNNTLYIAATNRGVNIFTNGISGYKIPAPHTIEQGLRNGTVVALDLRTGKIKWQYQTEFPPRVSPLVTGDIVFAGYIPFTEKAKTSSTTHGIKTQKAGVILALDKETGKKLWEFNVNAPIGDVGPSVGDGMLFVPTGKIEGLPREERVGGSVVAFGPP